jgi:hypothetical protein
MLNYGTLHKPLSNSAGSLKRFCASTFREIAPHLNPSNLLRECMKRVVAIDKFIKEVMRQIGAVVDDI